MKTQRVYVLTVILAFLSNILNAQGALDYNNNRIAISADGNIQPDLEYTGKYNSF